MRYLVLVPVTIIFVAGCGASSNNQDAVIIAKQDRAAWRKLKKGMSQEQVRAILGEPLHVDDLEEATCWRYQNSCVPRLDTENGWILGRSTLLFSPKVSGDPKLTEWKEP